jgi:hypothetical protein
VEKFATPLEQVTTPSLEALRAYTMARKAGGKTTLIHYVRSNTVVQ